MSCWRKFVRPSTLIPHRPMASICHKLWQSLSSRYVPSAWLPTLDAHRPKALLRRRCGAFDKGTDNVRLLFSLLAPHIVFRIGPSPAQRFSVRRYLKYFSVSQKRVRLLRSQRVHRRAEKFHAPAFGDGLCGLIFAFTGLRHCPAHHHFFALPINIAPFQRYEFARERELHHVARLTGEGTQHNLLLLRSEWIGVIRSRWRSLVKKGTDLFSTNVPS